MHVGAMETILPTKAPDSIDSSETAGFDGIELNVDGPDPGDDPVWTPEGRTRIRRRAAEQEQAVPSLCLGFLNGGGLTMDDPDTRADARHVLLWAIDAAAALGAETILVPFFGTGEIETGSHVDRVIDGVSRVADGGNYMLGEGEVDFAACVNALEGIGYEGWIVLETASPGDPLEDAATNRAFAADLR